MTKKIVFGSDIHLEFGDLDRSNEHNADILILAGDIATPHYWRMNHDGTVRAMREKQVGFFRRMSERFPQILYIPGNHEHYKGDYGLTEQILQEELAKFPNIKVGNHINYQEDGLTIIGDTLWTDFDKNNADTMLWAQLGMNDFRIVYKNDDTFKPADAYEIHKTALAQLEAEADLANARGDKLIVVSHHLPSLQVISAGFRDDRLNGAYASDLDWFIEKYKPAFWIHGHSHPPVDKMIGETRVMRNPRGYVGHEHSMAEDKAYNFKLIEA
jgi:Icc-related predicted phosphoesterase